MKQQIFFSTLLTVLFTLTACTTPKETLTPTSRVGLPATWTVQPVKTTSIIQPQTATPEPSSIPEKIEPMVYSIVHSSGLLVGGTKDGSWLSANDIAPYLGGNRTYQLLIQNENKQEAQGQLSNPPERFPCPERHYIDFPGVNYGIFSYAIEGDWNSIPRQVERLVPSPPFYKELVKDRLKIIGVGYSPVQIPYVKRTDLEGDGVEEIILSGSYFQDRSGIPSVTRGDYSYVILRQTIGNEVLDVRLFESYELNDKADGVPSFVRSVNVFDLNGDGVMEILVFIEYFDSIQVLVYDIETDLETPVLAIFCVATQ